MATKIATPPVQRQVPSWWKTMNYGAFVTYEYAAPNRNGSIYPNGSVPASVNELASNFDVADFVAAMVAYGVQYVIFTVWNVAMNPLYPSAVMGNWLPGRSANADLIATVGTALHAQGIKFIPYVHFTDYPDLTAAERLTIAASPYNEATYNALMQGLANEMATRWGAIADGFWIDMVFQSDFDQMIDTSRLRSNLLVNNPKRVIIGNDSQNWHTPSAIGNGLSDLLTREYYPTDATHALTWSATAHQAIPIFSNTGVWWSSAVSGSGDVTRDTAAHLFKWVVMQIAYGGLAWGLCPYVGSGGALFEDGVDAKMKAIWALINPVKASLIGVQSSPSWGLLINQFDYRMLSSGDQFQIPSAGNSSGFVATIAADGKTDYVHVLTAPSSGKVLTLPAPADGATFNAAKNLNTGNACALVTNSDQTLTVTLANIDSWDANDTVIALTPTAVRKAASAQVIYG